MISNIPLDGWIKEDGQLHWFETYFVPFDVLDVIVIFLLKSTDAIQRIVVMIEFFGTEQFLLPMNNYFLLFFVLWESKMFISLLFHKFQEMDVDLFAF